MESALWQAHHHLTSPQDLMNPFLDNCRGSSGFLQVCSPPAPPPRMPKGRLCNHRTAITVTTPAPMGYRTLHWFPMALGRKLKQLAVHRDLTPFSLLPVSRCPEPFSALTPSCHIPRAIATPTQSISCPRPLPTGSELTLLLWDLLFCARHSCTLRLFSHSPRQLCGATAKWQN